MVDILSRPQPVPDKREAYGGDPNQFVELRLPRGKGPYPVLLNLHGGYWRAKYDLSHAGHLCEALRTAGVATFNVEFRRVGDAGGGWPGTFADVRSVYRYVRQEADRFQLDLNRLVVMGHSAGGQLALCLAAHEASLTRAISLAGVVDLKKAFALHLSHDAVVEFLGGTPEEVRSTTGKPIRWNSGFRRRGNGWFMAATTIPCLWGLAATMLRRRKKLARPWIWSRFHSAGTLTSSIRSRQPSSR